MILGCLAPDANDLPLHALVNVCTPQLFVNEYPLRLCEIVCTPSYENHEDSTYKDIVYSMSDDRIFGFVKLAERPGITLEANAFKAYTQIFELVALKKFEHIWRLWNYIPEINKIENGEERYRSFNAGRHKAFAATVFCAEQAPTACGVGTDSNELIICFMAGKTMPRTIENPKQTSAYSYPKTYGAVAPIFSRAAIIPLENGHEALFISGTASIVGNQSVHIDDWCKQLYETVDNIQVLIDEANKIAKRKFSHTDMTFKVYIRDAEYAMPIKLELERCLSGASFIFVRSDICRADLLLEIEGTTASVIKLIC